MRPIIISAFLLYLYVTCDGQGISITNDGSAPHSSAMLEIKSTTKGLLLPRMTMGQRNSIMLPTDGLVVYQTDGIPGLYVFKGEWSLLSTSATTWNIAGNSGTNPATNFIGTTDNQPFRFRLNNQWAGEMNHIQRNVYLGFNAGSPDYGDYSYDNTAIGHQAFSPGTGGNITAVGAFALHLNTNINNTAMGAHALRYNTSGSGNTAVGTYAMYNNITGQANVAIGVDALNGITSGNINTAIGVAALANVDSSYSNTAVGAAALNALQRGDNNTGIGAFALSSASDLTENTAIGAWALENNEFGHYNTAVGAFALNSNQGTGNTAVGSSALFDNVSGINNVAVGDLSCYHATGEYNAALGQKSAYYTTTGGGNLACGAWALYNNTIGERNTALGNEALAWSVTGDYNVSIGAYTGTFVGYSFDNTISIGNHGYLNGATNQVFVGNLSSTWNGGNVGWSTFSDARVKRNINENVKGLDFIMRLRPVTFQRDIDAQTLLTGNTPTQEYPEKYDIEQIIFSGFLAQEVEQAANESGFDFSGITRPRGENDLYTLSYESFVVPLVKAMQEQQNLIHQLQLLNENQQTEMNADKMKIDLLMQRLDSLEKQIKDRG